MIDDYPAPNTRPHLSKWLLIATDLAMLLLANRLGFWLAERVRIWRDLPAFVASADSGLRLTVWLMLVLAAISWFWLVRGHYTQRRPFWDETRDVVIAMLVLAVVDAALMFMLKSPFSRLWWVATWAVSLFGVVLGRVLARRLMIWLGWWQRQVLVFGFGENAREAFAALKSERWLGYQVVGFVAPCADVRDAENLDDQPICGKPLLPYLLEEPAPRFLERFHQPAILIALETEQLHVQQQLVQRFSIAGADASIAPPLKGLPLYGAELTHFFSHEVLLLRVRNNLSRRASRFIKRTFDIVAASLLLLALAPLLLSVAWLVSRDGGPATFGHTRIGRHGKPFRCLKFRSMVIDAQARLSELLARDPEARAEWERDFKLKNDPRITPLGNFIRKTSLDELPQLINVLRGDMSLVGPRPVIADEVERYGEDKVFYLMARPGITGLWQISGRNDIDYDSRVALDCWYVRNWSLWYDIVILIKTIKVVLARDGAY